MTQPDPWAPLIEMYQLGALPIGYSRGEFVIYCPPCAMKPKRRAKADS